MTLTPATQQFQLLASTGIAGFAKINGTPTILQWTTPNDGAMHRVVVLADETVTVAETGGGIGVVLTAPGGGVQTNTTIIFAGTKAIGTYHSIDGMLVAPGTTLQITEGTALTAGTSTVWIEVWGT